MTYAADDIQVLKGLEAVRKRPGMYIGDTDGPDGFHHMLWEIVDNSVDEAIAGHCKQIYITVHENGEAIVLDDGRGIPSEMHPTEGRSALELVMTELHAGGKFGTGGYEAAGGLHGVGASVVNALSSEMKVTVHRDGKRYWQQYQRGVPVAPVQSAVVSDVPSGTMVRYVPDREIFQNGQTIELDRIRGRLRAVAHLVPGLCIDLEFVPTDSESIVERFHAPGGLSDYISEMAGGQSVASGLRIDGVYAPPDSDLSWERIEVTAALEWRVGEPETPHCFTNTIRNADGGTHLIGLRQSTVKTVTRYAEEQKLAKDLEPEDVLEGLAAALEVRLYNPRYSSQAKVKLVSSQAQTAVSNVVSAKLFEFLERNPRSAKAIVARCVIAQKARIAAERARSAIKRKTVMDGGPLPGKLADCSESDPEKTELFIVEGESAGGSAKQGRDRNFQAILPLKGKVLNSEKADSVEDVYRSPEIGVLISALGCGFGESKDISKLRYGRIIIMTDADVDGSHIRTLLLTFFLRYYPELVADGRVHIAQPPLYLAKRGGKKFYLKDKAALEEHWRSVGGPEGWTTQRYKGLGEMNPEQLWDTTLDPKTRTLLRVDLPDPIEADLVIRALMGLDAAPRREMIERDCLNVRRIDA